MIKVQKNLKCFKADYEVNGDEHRGIRKTLIRQANSLIHLKLDYTLGIFSPLNIFSKFNNLQRLELGNYDGYLHEKQLVFQNFLNLKFSY